MLDFFQGFHWGEIVSELVVLSAIGHAVSTFPKPENKYWAWVLATIQFVVGQRLQAAESRAVATGTFKPPANEKTGGDA